MLEMYRRDQFRAGPARRPLRRARRLEERLAELDALLAAASRAAGRGPPPAASAARPIFWGSKFCAAVRARRSADAAGAAGRGRMTPRGALATTARAAASPTSRSRSTASSAVRGCRRTGASSASSRRAGSAASRGIPATGSGPSLLFARRSTVVRDGRGRRANRRARAQRRGRPRRHHRHRSAGRDAGTRRTSPRRDVPTARADDHDRAAADRARLAVDRAPRRRRRPNPNALAVWPAGESGYTDVLESLPGHGRPRGPRSPGPRRRSGRPRRRSASSPRRSTRASTRATTSSSPASTAPRRRRTPALAAAHAKGFPAPTRPASPATRCKTGPPGIHSGRVDLVRTKATMRPTL